MVFWPFPKFGWLNCSEFAYWCRTKWSLSFGRVYTSCLINSLCIITVQQKCLDEDIQNLLFHIAVWMIDHFLCLNQGKTKILVTAPLSFQPEIIIRGVIIQNIYRNLGVILDNELSFECHINKGAKGCYATIKRLPYKRLFERGRINSLFHCKYSRLWTIVMPSITESIPSWLPV